MRVTAISIRLSQHHTSMQCVCSYHFVGCSDRANRLPLRRQHIFIRRHTLHKHLSHWHTRTLAHISHKNSIGNRTKAGTPKKETHINLLFTRLSSSFFICIQIKFEKRSLAPLRLWPAWLMHPWPAWTVQLTTQSFMCVVVATMRWCD